MANRWKTDSPEEASSPLDDFLLLFKTARAGRSANLPRLKMRIASLWEKLSLSERRKYTKEMEKLELIEQEVLDLLEVFDGTIADIHRLI